MTEHKLVSSTEVFGRRLLKEIEVEEESLEDLLTSLRAAAHSSPSKTGIPELDALWKAHQTPKLNITGRGLPLLYHLISSLVSSPMNGTVVVIDLDRRFSPSHLQLPEQELQYVHVFRPTKENLQVTTESVEEYMLYGEHGSKGREWVGTILNGGGAVVKGVDVVVGWRGWLRVERESVGTFAEGMSVEAAWEERTKRQEVVDGKGWKGKSKMGVMRWR